MCLACVRLALIATAAMGLAVPWPLSAQSVGTSRVQQREALEILRDLRQLADAALGDETPPDIPTDASIEALLVRLGRPTRHVGPHGLEPTELDRLIAETQAARGDSLTAFVGDEAFLRRVMLDLAGALPSPKQIRAYVADPAPDKRTRLIDDLLAGEAFARHWARYWRDVIAFRATAENPRLLNLDEFENWIAEAFAANRPWDEIVGEILTASGNSDENGATALYVAHSANNRFQPAELAGEASRIFLGVQIACAQCHDHPTDRWTQRQFHELAAFFAGTTVRRPDRQKPLQRLVADRPGIPRHGVPDKDDPKKVTPVQPRFFLEGSEDPLPRLNSEQARALAASYFTGPDNPWFARSFVNRVWYALMGRAFYMPIDDLGPDRTPEDHEILDALADAFVRGGYDIRWLYRTIASTEAYRRERPTARLRADALLDALVQAIDPPLQALAGRVNRNNGKPAPQVPVVLRGRFDARQIFRGLYGIDPSVPDDEVLGTIPQALFLMNNPLVHRGLIAGPRTVLGGILANHADDAAALDAIYLRTLARHPNADEKRVAIEYIGKVGNRREAFEDLLWAVINSAEFLSRN